MYSLGQLFVRIDNGEIWRLFDIEIMPGRKTLYWLQRDDVKICRVKEDLKAFRLRGYSAK